MYHTHHQWQNAIPRLTLVDNEVVQIICGQPSNFGNEKWCQSSSSFALLQNERKAHSRLAEKVAAGQAAPAVAASLPVDALGQRRWLATQLQQEVNTAETDQTSPCTKEHTQCLASATTGKRATVADAADSSASVAELWESILVGTGSCSQTSTGGTGTYLHLSATQVTALAAQYGRVKAEMESLQQSTRVQQVGCSSVSSYATTVTLSVTMPEHAHVGDGAQRIKKL